MPETILLRIETIAEYVLIVLVLARSVWALYNYRREVKESEREQKPNS